MFENKRRIKLQRIKHLSFTTTFSLPVSLLFQKDLLITMLAITNFVNDKPVQRTSETRTTSEGNLWAGPTLDRELFINECNLFILQSSGTSFSESQQPDHLTWRTFQLTKPTGN